MLSKPGDLLALTFDYYQEREWKGESLVSVELSQEQFQVVNSWAVLLGEGVSLHCTVAMAPPAPHRVDHKSEGGARSHHGLCKPKLITMSPR